MQMTVTNLTTTAQAGSLAVILTDNTGSEIYAVTNVFAVTSAMSTNVTFILPGTLSVGSYSLTASLTVGGGTMPVQSGQYIVRTGIRSQHRLCSPRMAAYSPSDGGYSHGNAGAGIGYIIGGTTNLMNYTGPFTVTNSVTVTAWSSASGYNDSPVKARRS